MVPSTKIDLLLNPPVPSIRNHKTRFGAIVVVMRSLKVRRSGGCHSVVRWFDIMERCHYRVIWNSAVAIND